tara:strand:+ start:1684 stop:2073 length:390 start_codon:yes stop_codon:yes gene_type:complete
MKHLKAVITALFAALAFAGAATADTVIRSGIPVGDSTSVVAWQIHTGGQIVYVTSDAMLKGRTPQTDNLVVIDNTVDLFDQDAAVAYVQANYGATPYVITHEAGGVLKAGADGLLGTADDYRTPTRDWF